MMRYNVAAGLVNPSQVPYFLALIGGPTDIPFAVQSDLVDYAVGRIAFDNAEDYQRYAEGVVRYEENAEAGRPAPNRNEVVFWGPQHTGDPATQLTAGSLLTPLAYGTAHEPAISSVVGCGQREFIGRVATRTALSEVFHSPADTVPPAVLFAASHGLGWPSPNPDQRAVQGSLVCQEWPGLGSVLPKHYLQAANIRDDARVGGLIAVLVACYGAGTPDFDPYAAEPGQEPVRVADAPFIARLPQRLLAHPGGGALAVLGHVERLLGYSVQPLGVGPQPLLYRNLLGYLLSGQPIGHAAREFRERFASLSALLAGSFDPTQAGSPDERRRVTWWAERNDAGNFLILGDPAVRLSPALRH
jgi:hypothetical protein